MPKFWHKRGDNYTRRQVFRNAYTMTRHKYKNE